MHSWKNTMVSIFKIEDLKPYLNSNFFNPSYLSRFYTEVLDTWVGVKYNKIETKEDRVCQYLWLNRDIPIKFNS